MNFEEICRKIFVLGGDGVPEDIAVRIFTEFEKSSEKNQQYMIELATLATMGGPSILNSFIKNNIQKSIEFIEFAEKILEKKL